MNQLIQFLYHSVSPPPLSKEPIPFACSYCAISGEPIVAGHPITEVIKPGTGDITDTFRYPSNYVGVQAAELFRAQKLLRGNLFITEKEMLKPLISHESATQQDRLCWRTLIREIKDGTQCVAIFSDESKRRLWPQAKLSTIGPQWRPFLNGSVVKAGSTFKAPPIARSLNIDITKLRIITAAIEDALSYGFTKRGVYENLLSETKAIARFGLQTALDFEKLLTPFRCTDEFLLGLFISQRIEIRVPPAPQLHPSQIIIDFEKGDKNAV